MRVGQNLASIVDYTRAMEMWWSEVKDYNFNTSYMEHYRKGRVIGHYTQVRTSQVDKFILATFIFQSPRKKIF